MGGEGVAWAELPFNSPLMLTKLSLTFLSGVDLFAADVSSKSEPLASRSGDRQVSRTLCDTYTLFREGHVGGSMSNWFCERGIWTGHTKMAAESYCTLGALKFNIRVHTFLLLSTCRRPNGLRNLFVQTILLLLPNVVACSQTLSLPLQKLPKKDIDLLGTLSQRQALQKWAT